MNRYTQIKEIGHGAYGRAILVEAKATKEKLVVKEMDLTKLPIESQETCRAEVKLLASLQHRNVVRYHDSFEERRKLYIVMEYCDGGDLEDKINPPNPLQPMLTEKEIWDYFVQICLALKYLHGKKVLHRDLKPSNIFLTKKGEVKLGDFGVSRTLKHTMELATTFAGTPVYLSPEVVDSKPYNDKSDVWSLGCVLYEMATRDLPFEATNIMALCRQIMAAPHRQLPSTFSAELRQLVNEMLTKSPSQRPSISQILQKPVVRTIARRFLSDREVSKGVPVNPPAAAKPCAVPVDSLLVYKKLKSPEEPVKEPPKKPAGGIPVLPLPAKVAAGADKRPQLVDGDRLFVRRQLPKDFPPMPVKVASEEEQKRLLFDGAGFVVPRHAPKPKGYVALYRLAPARRDPEPPKPNRLVKPANQIAHPERPAAPVPAPRTFVPAAEPPKIEKSLYEELLELGDDFDINNLDLTGEKWFKDEIDAQAQAKLANGADDAEEAPPSYDELATDLQQNPASPRNRKPAQNATVVPTNPNPITLDDDGTLSPRSAQRLKDELLALDGKRIGLESFPAVKEDEEDDGPDNFSTLFTLPTADVKDKDLSLYDELLAIELHNREVELAGVN